MEDFDLERLKKIKSELFNILDECSYFENIILDYYYEIYNLNQYKNFPEETITENFVNIINNTKNFIDKYMNNTPENYTEELASKFENIFEFPNNDSFNRKCWNYRGIFFDDIVKEDQINYNNYLEYKQKLKSIEECEADENINCIETMEDFDLERLLK